MAFQRHQATKFTYSCQHERWERQSISLRVSESSFSEGGMRSVYRAREVLPDGAEIDCVVKRLKPDLGLSPDMNYDEAMTQMVAESYAQEFNKACALRGLSCTIAFLPVSVVLINGQREPLCLEPYLEGDYVKHNDNNGHDMTHDEVAASFSYFTYITSNKLLVVCDIQGVGTFYTDPQIHTFDGEGFGGGNIGAEGIQRFLRSHKHNLLCEQLGLPSLDAGRSDEEIARRMQEEEDQSAIEHENGYDTFGFQPILPSGFGFGRTGLEDLFRMMGR